MLPPRGAPGKGGGDCRHRERSRVGNHVARVAQQRERSGPQPARELDYRVARGERERHGKPRQSAPLAMRVPGQSHHARGSSPSRLPMPTIACCARA